MSATEQPAQPTLDQYWLDVATKDLTSPAKERVRPEIEAHFAAAVANHTSSGMEPSKAQIKALEELGDPKAAAKRFNKQHLTISDAKAIGQLFKSCSLQRWAISTISFPLVVWICWKFNLGVQRPFSATGICLIALFWVMNTFSCVLVRRNHNDSTLVWCNS